MGQIGLTGTLPPCYYLTVAPSLPPAPMTPKQVALRRRHENTRAAALRLKYSAPNLNNSPEQSQWDIVAMLEKPPAAATDFVEGFEREQTLHKYLAQAAPLRAQRKKRKQEKQSDTTNVLGRPEN